MIKLNGQKVKPSREILPLDYIEIRKEQIWRKFQILDIPKTGRPTKKDRREIDDLFIEQSEI
jgi:ribosomal 50S subunit-recycling heat shock protein